LKIEIYSPRSARIDNYRVAQEIRRESEEDFVANPASPEMSTLMEITNRLQQVEAKVAKGGLTEDEAKAMEVEADQLKTQLKALEDIEKERIKSVQEDASRKKARVDNKRGNAEIKISDDHDEEPSDSDFKRIIDDIIKKAPKVVTKRDMPWKHIIDEKYDDFILAAAHCMLNGPVGVGKETTFGIAPDQKTFKIKSVFSVECTSKQWRRGVRTIAQKFTDRGIIIECQMLTLFGKYWPLASFTPGALKQNEGQ